MPVKVKSIATLGELFLTVIACTGMTLLENVLQNGAGKRYLIQHSAGSGKSNSIAWLAHQLIGLRKADKNIFDSVIVITDRRILDDQSRTQSKVSCRLEQR
jgi:type I site-specific restriction-modification system R (restriction) subunit